MAPVSIRNLCFALLVAACPAWALDHVIFLNGRTEDVLLVDYEAGRFEFMRSDETTFKEQAARIRSVEFLPAAKVDLILKRDVKPVAVDLLRFDKDAFVTSASGQETTHAASVVKEIRVSMTDRRTVNDFATASAVSAGPVYAETLAVSGKVTIVHFHAPQVASSVRQGSFVRQLASEHPEQVEVRRVDVDGFDSPVAAQFGLQTLPQFWFYTASGALSGKLTDRFTEEDIAEALRKAME